MCGGIEVRDGDKARKIYFVGDTAALPVLVEDSAEIEWIRWGRRKSEKSSLPQGGWARLSAIQAGDWQVYQPRRGIASVDRFLQGERSSGLRGRRLSQWVSPPPGQGIECLVIGEGDARRAYVITTAPPAKFKAIADRWPSLIDLPRTLAKSRDAGGIAIGPAHPENSDHLAEHTPQWASQDACSVAQEI